MAPPSHGRYLLGITNVPLRTYVAASCVGALPNVAAHVYVGTLLDSLADIATGRRHHSPATWALLVGGCVATLGVLGWVSRAAASRIRSRRAAEAGLPLHDLGPLQSPSTPTDKRKSYRTRPAAGLSHEMQHL